MLHIAGDTQQILSGVLIQIDEELIENYAKLLTRLYSISLAFFFTTLSMQAYSSNPVYVLEQRKVCW